MIRFIFLAVLLHLTQLYANPVINIWYGESQKISHGGSLLDWCLHGSVEYPFTISKVSATLNNTNTINLNFDSSSPRLSKSGNFVAEFPVSEFITGKNTIKITALDKQGQKSEKIVEVTKDDSKFPRDFSIDWSKVSHIQDVCNVGDGKWGITTQGVRTIEPGYDRFLCIGNIEWRDYEVESRILIHSFNNISYCGFLMRFVQHYPVDDAQPKWGYKPLGGLCWFGNTSTAVNQLNQLRPQLCHGMGGEIDYPAVPVFVNQWQRIKAKCETIRDDGSTNTTRYSFKTWKDGDPEPASWTFSNEVTDIKNGSLTGLRNGSLGLISYMADVTFGNVVIRPAGIDQNVTAILPSGRFYHTSAKNNPNPASACFVNNVQSANSPALTGLIFSPAGRLQNRTNSHQRAHGIWIFKNAGLDK